MFFTLTLKNVAGVVFLVLLVLGVTIYASYFVAGEIGDLEHRVTSLEKENSELRLQVRNTATLGDLVDLEDKLYSIEDQANNGAFRSRDLEQVYWYLRESGLLMAANGDFEVARLPLLSYIAYSVGEDNWGCKTPPVSREIRLDVDEEVIQRIIAGTQYHLVSTRVDSYDFHWSTFKVEPFLFYSTDCRPS